MAETAPDDPVERGRAPDGLPVRTYRTSLGRRAGDAIVGVLIRAGLVPHSYLLTTRGRRTGHLRTTPVTVVERDGRRWLVAPYGPVSWVHNARAAGRVTLRRRHGARAYAVHEVPPEEAGPVLKQYVQIARPTRPYFRADKDAPVEEFIGEADRHPVFELTPLTSDRLDGCGEGGGRLWGGTATTSCRSSWTSRRTPGTVVGSGSV